MPRETFSPRPPRFRELPSNGYVSSQQMRLAARDIATSGALLRDLFARHVHWDSSCPLHDRALGLALMANPSLPVDMLAYAMAYYPVAWENPSAPLALLHYPHVVEWAQDLLAAKMSDSSIRQGDITVHVSRVANMSVSAATKKPAKMRAARQFARVLADRLGVACIDLDD